MPPPPRAPRSARTPTRRRPGGRRARGRPRTARGPVPSAAWPRTARHGLALVEVDADASSAPRLGVHAHDVAVAQRATSGPPAAASGVQWIAAGTLPEAPRHAAVGDERDAVAAVHQHAERGRELVQLGHAVRARALVADDRDEVARRARRGRRRRGSRAWSSKTRAGAVTTRCSGATADTFITARPSAPSSTRMPPSGANGVGDAGAGRPSSRDVARGAGASAARPRRRGTARRGSGRGRGPRRCRRPGA